MAEDLSHLDTHVSAPTERQLSALTQAARELVAAEATIARLEKELKEANAKLLEITTVKLPDLLDAAGTDIVGLPDSGVDIILKPFYKASISAEWPPQQQQAAFDWLEQHGHGDLIRNQLQVQFLKEEGNMAGEVAGMVRDKLTEMGIGDRPVVLNKTVHHMTLTAFVREQIESGGEALPLATLGAIVGRVATIKKRT